MSYGNRRHDRVAFDRGINAMIVAIDGAWRRECMLADISQGGARLNVKGGFGGLDLSEFYLMLSPTGRVYRKCQLVRTSGTEIGVRFLT